MKSKSTLIATIIVVLLLSITVYGIVNTTGDFISNLFNDSFEETKTDPKPDISNLDCVPCSILASDGGYIQGGTNLNSVLTVPGENLVVKGLDNDSSTLSDDHERATLLKFKINDVIDKDILTTATLRVYFEKYNNDRNFDIYLVSNNWTPSTLCANNAPNIDNGIIYKGVLYPLGYDGNYYYCEADISEIVKFVTENKVKEFSIMISSTYVAGTGVNDIQTDPSYIIFNDTVKPILKFSYTSYVKENVSITHIYDNELLDGKCISCGTTCPHINTTRNNFSSLSISEHRYKLICNDCGFVSLKNENHTFVDNGKCDYCNYVCSHYIFERVGSYFVVDGSYHDINIMCNSCNMSGTYSSMFNKKLPHEYNENRVCNDCKYISICEHSLKKYQYVPNDYYQPPAHDVYEVCIECNHRIYYAKESCNFAAGECVSCDNCCSHTSWFNTTEYVSSCRYDELIVCTHCRRVISSTPNYHHVSNGIACLNCGEPDPNFVPSAGQNDCPHTSFATGCICKACGLDLPCLTLENGDGKGDDYCERCRTAG